jgi:hypothetical protein
MGRDASYTERLLFDPPEQEIADPDEVIIASGFAEHVKEKFKGTRGARRGAAVTDRPGGPTRAQTAWPSRS